MGRTPTLTYFCQKANLPGLTLGSAEQQTPFRAVPWSSTKMQWGELNITFLVDEELKNWLEIFNWMNGLALSEGFSNYKGNNFSPATLTIMTNNKLPNIEVDFRSCCPVSLSEIQFSSDQGNQEYLTASASFAYTHFDVRLLEQSFESKLPT